MTYTDDELIDHIRRLATDDTSPTTDEFDEDPDAPSSATVINRFGSWNDAVNQAGLTPNQAGVKRTYSTDEILEHIRRLATGDTPPTLNELDTDPDAPSSTAILERFDSWNDALSQANLTSRQPGSQHTYTDADILDHIRRLAADTSPPTRDEFDEDPDAPSISTVHNRFDSWNDAVSQAGLTPRQSGGQQSYTTDEIIGHIRRLATDDIPPKTDKLDANPDAPSSTTVADRFGSWNNALVEAGFDPNTQQYTDDELLNHIRRLATDDSPPTHAEFVADPDAPSSSTVYDRFGSWAEAVRQANFTPRQPGSQHTYSDTEILGHIRRLATDDTPPTCDEFDEDPDAPNSATVHNRFDSWNDAVSQAGLTPRQGGVKRTYDTDEILEHIQRLATDDTPPTAAEFDADPDAPSSATVTDRVGSWNNALVEAGFDPNLQQYTPDEILEHIRRLATDTSPPTRDEFDADPDAPSSATVKRRFGGWNDAVGQAGLTPRQAGVKRTYDTDEILEHIQRLATGNTPPTTDEFDADPDAPSSDTVTDRFGTWNNAVSQAGFDTNPQQYTQQYTPDEILEHIRRLATDDTPPTAAEFDADPDAPSSTTVYNLFGSWKDALVEAGFDAKAHPTNQQ